MDCRGDFNVISFLDEYSGHTSQDLHAMEDFNDFISIASLQQITPMGVNIHGLESGKANMFGSGWIEYYAIVVHSNYSFIL